MTPGLIQRLALFARHHYRALFVAFALLLLLAAVAISRLRFDADVLNLLPRHDPVINTFRATLADFGTIDYMFVVVRIPEHVALDPYEMLADDLAAQLTAMPALESVEHKLGDPEELMRTFFPKAVLFLDDAERRELAEHATDEAIRRRVSELRRLLATPQGMAVKELVKLDPLGLSDVFLTRLDTTRSALEVDWSSGYYLSRDHRLLLILCKPRRPPQDIDFTRQMIAGVRAALASTVARWPEIAGPEPPPAPTVDIGGTYLTALYDANLIGKDIVVNMATSLLGVLLLFLFAFRRLGALLYAFLPLLCGLVLTFGFSAATLGVVSSATSGTAALLIGLGIDFVIVSYGRYVEERRRGLELEPALLQMAGSSSRAVFIGAVTTVATFYAFFVTDFVGLRQMGFLTGTGILFCMVSVFLLLPAMLAWSEDHHARRRSQPRLFLHSFGADRLVRLCLRRPGQVLLVGALATVAAAGLCLRIQFDESIKAMRPAGNPGVLVGEEVAEHFHSAFDYMMLVVEGKDLAEVLHTADESADRAKEAVASGLLSGVNGINTLIPPPRQQAEALAWLARERGGALDPARIERTFAAAAAEEGLRLEPFEPGFQLLASAISPTEPIGVESFPEGRQTHALLDRFLRRTPDGWKSVVYLYPAGTEWRRKAPPELFDLARELGPSVVLTGANVVNALMRQRVPREAELAAVVGLLLVGLLLWLDFRRLRDTLLALTPLAVGILWMLAGMALLGIAMNFMNIFVTTMIIGIGVDYGVHMLHRYAEVRGESDAEVERGLLETAKAVVAAALSTVVGFGSLSFSHYPGLRSTGFVAVLGALSTALVAITLLPAYLALRRRRARQPSPPSSTTV